MAICAISGVQVWDGLDRYNSLTPVAIVAYDSSVTGYVPVNISQIGGQSFSNSNYVPASGASTILESNPLRSLYEIQNVGTGVLYLKKGVGAGPNSYNLILKGGNAINDGLGAYYEDTKWKGPVSISGQFGTSGLYLYSEQT